MYYINMYLFGCFIGYIIETILKFFFFHSMNNGILYGPWIPLYGFGVLLILLLSSIVFKKKITKIKKVILLFILLFISITFLEEVGGLLIEFIFHKKFWNYRKMLFNKGPYISLEMSILWGILGILFLFIKPLLELVIKKIPSFVTIGILLIHIIDIIFTWLV